MKYLSSILFSFFLCLSTFSLSSQNESQNTLLWKIEGRNLNHPSYLFGSMHVSDKRVFNFSDSVFIAIESCDAFALEVHPDSVLIEVLNSLHENFDESYYEDLLSEEELLRFKKKFKDINGYDFEDLDNKNPLSVKDMLEPNFDKEDDKETFVDGYLYAIAKMLKKEILGLEDYKDQIAQIRGVSKEEQRDIIMSTVDYPEDLARDKIEEMISIYATGELDKIEMYLNNSEYNDSLMILRNEVMTNSIVETLKTKTLFSTVGAAHLIGKGSVVQMLKDRGYKVRPVKSIFTGLAEQYVPDVMKMDWEIYTDTSAGFEVMLPGTPNQTSTDFMEMTMYMDLGSQSVYAFMHRDIRHEPTTLTTEEMIDDFVNNMSENNSNIVSQKTIETNHGPKTELLVKQGDKGYFKAQVSKVNGFIYIFFYWGNEEQMKSPAQKKFFNSVRFTTPKKPKLKSGWFTYTDTLNAFSVRFPSAPQKTIQEHENPLNPKGDKYKIHVLYAVDMDNATNYIIAYNDMPLETYMENSEEGLNSLITDLNEGGNTVSELDTINLNGILGRSFNCKVQGQFLSKLHIYQRGNRTYKVMKQNLKQDKVIFTEDNFFESFQMLPYAAPNYVSRTNEFEQESFLDFENTSINRTDTIDFASYFDESYASYSRNSATGAMHQIEMHRLSDYFKIKNLDSFYLTFEDNLVTWQDTLLHSKIFNKDDRRKIELKLSFKGSNVISRYQFWIHKNIFYSAGISGTKKDISSESADLFFNSFYDNNGGQPLDYFASKGEKIIEALGSKNTLIRDEAKGALQFYYIFDESEIPFILNGLKKTYEDDTLASGIKCSLINELISLHAEEATNQLIETYTDKSSTPVIKEAILTALIGINTSKSMEAYTNFLFNNPLEKIEAPWSIFHPFTDSLSLFETHIQDLIDLYSREDHFKNSILDIFKTALMAEKENVRSLIEPHFSELTATAMDELNDYITNKKTNPEEYNYNPNLRTYLSIMNQIRGQSLTDEYTQLFAQQDTFLLSKALAMKTRIYNDLPIDKNKRNELLKDLDFRGLLMEAYVSIDQINQVPKKYTTSEEIGKMRVYDYLYEEEFFNPEKISLLKKISHQNKDYLIFKFNYPSTDESYLCAFGPLDPKSIKSTYQESNVYSNYTTEDKDWETNIRKLIEGKTEN